jgi:hypothetical protein
MASRNFFPLRMRWLWYGLVLVVLSAAAYSIYHRKSEMGQTGDRDLEVRLDFIPFRPRPDFRDSLALILRGDGRVRVIHHRRQMFVDAAYEGTLPEADAMRFVSRARAARDEWKLPNMRLLGRSDDELFSMVVLPSGSANEESIFGGNVGAASESTRRLIEDLLELWKRLDKSPPAEAYLRSLALPEPELKRIQQNEQRRVLPVEKVPPDLQPVLLKSLNQPRDFVPVSRQHHDQLLDYRQFIITNKGFSYRLNLSLPTPTTTN